MLDYGASFDQRQGWSSSIELTRHMGLQRTRLRKVTYNNETTFEFVAR
jgi:hypothetical protein